MSDFKSDADDSAISLESEALRLEVERIRVNRILGRPGQLSRLFELLYQASLSGRSVKEIDVALNVFGKDPSFDTTQDALVRVYFHKLRRKLDQYYSQPEFAGLKRIVIPMGEYRFVLASCQSDIRPSVAGEGQSRALRSRAG